jgi:fluoroacetyl-CoA thioesterase
VGPQDTARALGSGDLEVLGTPRLLAWCEAATCAALTDLAPGVTSVGTRATLEHLSASAVGAVVEVTARVEHADGRLRRLAVVATCADALVATAEITRVVVDRDRFLSRL